MQLSLLCVSGRGSRMILTVPQVPQLLLVALLLNTEPCRSELRVRDPDVVEGQSAGLRGWPQLQTQGTGGSDRWPGPHGYHSTSGALQPQRGTPAWPLRPSEESSHQPTTTGFSPSRNWCAFVHRRVLTVAVLCGTETHQGRSVTPCPSHDLDCQMTRCEPSSRPVYRQMKRILTGLHWRCCPGHGGSSCQETVNPKGQSQASEEHTGEADMDVSGVEDTGVRSEVDLLEGAGWEDSHGQQSPSGPLLSVPPLLGTAGAIWPSAPLPFIDSASLLMVHQGMAALLQPALDAFNRSLERLSSEVEAMSLDLQQLRQERENNMSHNKQAHRGTIEEKLADSFEQIRQLQAKLSAQEKHIEQAVRSQQDLLQHNLTILREDIDHHINQSHEDLKGSLQSVIASVEESRLSQERLEGVRQGERPLPGLWTGGQPGPESSMWEAINSLDEKVLNTTKELSALSESSVHFASVTQNLEHGLQNLRQVLEQVSQNSEVRFTETALEIEAARTAALNSVNEVAANLSTQTRQLRELELYVDSFYQHLQVNEPATVEETCSCKELSESLASMAQEVANVTDLARENRYALEDAEAKKGQGDWPIELEDLHQGLLSVKESLAFEQAKSRTLGDSISQLKALLLNSQEEIFQFREIAMAKSAEIRHLSASFASLLKDAIRHSDVLEVLLGDEVMEFLSWSSSQQQELSIPSLLQRIQLLQEKTESHEVMLTSVNRNSEERDRMASDDAGAFSERTVIKEQRRGAADQSEPSTGTSAREDDRDNSARDIWSLGQKVEELADRLNQLEEQYQKCTAAPSGATVVLQREVTSLRQALGEHLRMFQNLFTYSEELSSSPRSLNLDQLWAAVNGKDRKRKDKRNANNRLHKGGKGSGQSHSSVAFIAGLDDRTRRRGRLLFKNVTLNHGNAYSPSSGVFDAPQNGVYLFLVTLDFEKGPCLARLMREARPVATFRQDQGQPLSRALLLELRTGERVTLELAQGTLGQGQANESTLSGVLLFNTEDTRL